MVPYHTPKAHIRRVGIWASPLFAAILLLAFLAVTPLMPAAQGASETDTLNQQLSLKLDALEQANAQLQALAAELQALEKAKDAVAAALADTDGDILAVQNDIEQTEADLTTLRIQIENRLVNIYKDGGSWSIRYLEALMVGESLTDVLSRFDMLSKLADEDEQLFGEVEGYLERAQVNESLLQEKKVEQQAQLDELVQSEEQLSAKQTQFAAQKSSLENQIASLRAQIKQAEAAAAAAAAARLKAVADAADQASDSVGDGSSGDSSSGNGSSSGSSSSGSSSGSAGYPSSSAEVQAQARFIEKTYLEPRASVLSGMQVMEVWRKYNITPAQCLAVLNAESGMGSLKWGGRLVSEGNNFGCMSYSSSPSWANWSPSISFGKIWVGTRYWMKFHSVADGMEAWGRYITYGLGRDCYRPLMRAANWTGFANIYYGANVPGKEKYIERVTWAYNMLKRTSAAAGYSW